MRRLKTPAFIITAFAVLAGLAPVAATAAELPEPLPAGRLAYSTAVYETSDEGASHYVNGLGTMRLDGTDQRKLTEPVWPVYDHSPDWSPDGRWLVAMRNLAEPDSPTSSEIRVTSADGTRSEVVGHGLYPSWSPDGRTLAWASKDPDRPGIRLLDVDITGEELATDTAGARELPTPRRVLASSWDPLGGGLAVWMDQDGSEVHRELWHVDVTTAGLRQLATGIYQDHHSIRPAWHPAGLQLAVIARRADAPDLDRAWLVAADGSGHSRLIADDEAENQSWVSWAPNGLSLAVETSNDVFLVTPLGVVLGNLAPDWLHGPATPVWSPDGTRVYVVADEFTADEGASNWKPELWALPLVGDDVRQLTTDSSVFPTTATAVDPGLALRIIGGSPADTAAEVADRLPDSSTVVITTAESAPAATPLAIAKQAPLLETSVDSLPDATRRELEERRPTVAWVVGRVSDEVVAQLRDLGVTTIHRVAGADESAVAASVAEQVPATTAFLAPAAGPVEQAAAAAVAGARSAPLLLTGSSALGSSTREALQDLGVTTVHLTAASSAVSSSVEEELRTLGISVQRLGGSSPSDAALRLAGAFAGTSSMDRPVVVPKGSPDIGGPLLAASRRTVLLPAGTDAADPVVGFIDAHSGAIGSVDLMAGPASLTPGLEMAVERAVQGNAQPTEAPAPAEPTPSSPPYSGAGPRPVDSACPARVPEDGFTDVPQDNAHERAVDCLVWWGVTRGRTSTQYAPRDTVTRAQMATFIAQLVLRSGGQLPAAGADVFADDDGSPHEDAINRLARAGIVSGRTDGSYGPHLPVTRDAMAKFLVLALEHRRGTSLPPSSDRFADDNGNTHEANINRAAAAGLTGGTTASTYAPTLPVRRDQMASFLARSLALLVDEGVSSPPA